MWTYTQTDAYPMISLHDCIATDIRMDGHDLLLDFPDGFRITPCSPYSTPERPVRTGAAQLCFRGLSADSPIDRIDIYKTTRLFGKPLFCRRLQPDDTAFLKRFNREQYTPEFLSEYHDSPSALYPCCIRKADSFYAECQIELTARHIEYRWNTICGDRQR